MPSINRKETFKDNKMDIRKGEIKKCICKGTGNSDGYHHVPL